MIKKWAHIFLLVLIGDLIYSQNDSTVGNPFSNTSIYQRIEDIYIGNYGLAKYSLLSPFEDNSINQYVILPSNSDSLFYTDIFCLLGLSADGIVEINHHQPLSKNLNLNLNYFRSSSNGAYQRQKATQSRFYGELNYRSSSNKYGFNLIGNFFSRKNELNGGINDSIFTALYELNALQTLFPVNLQTAEMQKKFNEITFSQSFSFLDSVNDKNYWSLNHELGYNRFRYNYSDQQNDFYEVYYVDSLQSSDSLFLDYLSNRLSLSKRINKTIFELGHEITYADYKADSIYRYSLIQSSFLNLTSEIDNIKLNSRNKFTFSGFYTGNISSKNRGEYSMDSNSFFNRIALDLNFSSLVPEFYYHNYHSNRRSWNSTLNKTTKLEANFGFISDKHDLNLFAKWTSANNFIYFDSAFSPKQTNLSFYQIGITKKFHFLKRLTWIPMVYYQGVNSDENIEVPSLFTFNRFYVEGSLFKKVMRFHIGFDIKYFTSFTPRAYDPGFDQFFVQRTNTVKAGNYPYIDAFAEFYLKTYMSIFIKSEHVTNGVFGPNYLAAPTYRSTDRTIFAGIKWRLYN